MCQTPQLAEGHDYYGQYSDNALDWYHRSASQVLFMNHVLIDPPVDRSKNRVDVRDVYVTVDGEDDNGIRVSGAKMVATGSALTHATFVAVNSGVAARMKPGRDDMALVFIVDMDAPGLKVICRPSYEAAARHPFEASLASRYDENDAVIVFDKTFIPWATCWPIATSRRARASMRRRVSSTAITSIRPPGYQSNWSSPPPCS